MLSQWPAFTGLWNQDGREVLRHRMMVAEALTRHSGSPINGETPSLSHVMPSSSPYCPRDVMMTSGSSQHGGPLSPQSDQEKDMLMGDGLMYHRSSSPGGGYPVPSSVEMSNSKRKDLFNQRKQREFIPDNKKDESYWDRRRRNNEAAKRSREKRRFNDMILEQRVVELTKENHILKAQLTVIKEKYGISGENLINLDHVLASLPTTDQVLSLTKRTKLLTSTLMQINGVSAPSTPQPGMMSSHQGPLSRQHPSSVSPPPQSIITPSQTSPAIPNSPTPVPTPVIHEPIPLDGKSHHADYHHHLHHPHPGYPPEHCGYGPPPYHQPLYVNGHLLVDGGQLLAYEHNVLNLSRDRTESFSSSGGSPVAHDTHDVSSGDEQHPEPSHSPHAVQGMSNLPHKLRHKSHLGDKDAATALLSLQNIKQEPRTDTSPVWAVDAEDTSGSANGSSDERDSGISVGECWPQGHLDSGSPPPRKKSRGRRHPSESATVTIEVVEDGEEGEKLQSENSHLKSELARLASEVANLKDILTCRKKPAPTHRVPTAAEKKEVIQQP